MSKTQIVLATGEVYDVEDKGERRILIPVGYIKQKVILMGRLTRDPQVRYTQGQDSMAIARFTLAVDRRGRKQEGQQDADFPSCVAFGKSAEFVEKYVHQGTKIVLLSEKEGCDDMGLKEALRKVGQAIEETKMKIGMKKYKKGGIQIEEKDQKTEKVIPINDIPLPEEKKETEDAEIRKIEDLPAYEDRKFYIAAKMQVEPEEVEKVIRKTEAEWNLSPDKAAETLKMISDAAVKLNMVFTEIMENIRQVADKISEVFRRIHENNTMTEAQIRKRELWRRYYEEKSQMSNNERRRRGIPMVKRPKRQQYRPPKKKTTKG